MEVHRVTVNAASTSTTAVFACFFQRVEPGPWTVSAQHGQMSAQERVEAREGQVTEVLLRLQ